MEVHLVCNIYCSDIPIGYDADGSPRKNWESLLPKSIVLGQNKYVLFRRFSKLRLERVIPLLEMEGTHESAGCHLPLLTLSDRASTERLFYLSQPFNMATSHGAPEGRAGRR